MLQFELDPKFRDFIPKLVEFTGQMLNIHVYDDQEVMFVDRDTGEVAYEDARCFCRASRANDPDTARHVRRVRRHDARVLQGPREREEVPGMEKIKGKRVRVAAGKRKTRTATVHFRTETSVTPERRHERLQAVFAALFVCACIAATWALEATVWPR